MSAPTYSHIRSVIRSGDDVSAFAQLIGTDAELLHMTTPLGSWIRLAANDGRLAIVKWLLKAGVDPNRYMEDFRGNALDAAAAGGHLAVMECLLDHGCMMDVSEPTRNPLFSAIYGGHLDAAKLLVERGIDFRVKYTGTSMKGMDAYAYARERGQAKIAMWLKGLLADGDRPRPPDGRQPTKSKQR